MKIRCKKVVGEIILCCLLPVLSFAQLKRYQLTQPKMGSPFIITVYHHDSVFAYSRMNEAFQLVDSLNTLFSDYDSTALAYNISDAAANEWITVPAEMMHLLIESKNAHALSSGSFDITMGTVTRFWRKQRKLKVFPDADAVRQVMQHTGWGNVELDEANLRIRKKDAALRFDFGGIAKGYAAQKVVDYLKQCGITSSLADAGGDLVCGAAPPDKKGWVIAVNVPQQEEETWPSRLVLQNKAIATSGDMYQVMEHDGKFYSHIINPANGYGVSDRRNVTVMAHDGATADWLATAFSILPIKKARKLAKKMKAEFLIAALVNEKMITFQTPNFPDLQ